MKKLRCESQADIFGKRDSHQWLVYMMVKWRLPCLENVINTLVWYNNTHISFAINYIALFLQSHPMWVARVPVGSPTEAAIMRAVAPHVGGASARTPPRRSAGRPLTVAPHVGGASARVYDRWFDWR